MAPTRADLLLPGRIFAGAARRLRVTDTTLTTQKTPQSCRSILPDLAIIKANFPVSYDKMLSHILLPQNVLLKVAFADKLAALAAFSARAAEQRDGSKTAILSALQRHESLGSSAIGGGIALPHATIEGLAAPFAVLAVLAAPIDFSSIIIAKDDANASGTTRVPVDLVFLLLTPPGHAGEHLKVLSAVARRLRDPDVPRGLRLTTDVAAARDLLLLVPA